MTKFLNISTDTTLGGLSPSDEVVSSQKALKTYIDNHGGGGSVAIDNSTITKNGDDEIQAVATVNANTAAGATNPIYDWVGTLAEYTTQDVATNHPDWVCYITDDASGSSLFVTKGHEVIDFQEPNAGNNYTWYRKYADGWVEQGGYVANTGNENLTVTLPVPMYDANYDWKIGLSYNSTENATYFQLSIWSQTATNFVIRRAGNIPKKWYVCGMAA